MKIVSRVFTHAYPQNSVLYQFSFPLPTGGKQAWLYFTCQKYNYIPYFGYTPPIMQIVSSFDLD